MDKIIAFLASIILSITAFAHYEYSDFCHSAKNERICITIDQLQFHDNNIYAFYYGDWHQVYVLYSDGEHMFVDSKQASPETWYCDVCRTYHNADQRCPQAGKKKVQ